MPQMYPMNWFMFSLFLTILMSMSLQSENFSNKNHENNFIFLKNIKWTW